MNWNELSIYEKANLMKLYVANGITDLNTIKEHYNSFQDGGPMEPKEKEPNFVTRLKQGNSRKGIIDNQGNPASHKLSVADSRVYAGVQEDEKGNLVDYGAIPYRRFYAYDRALKNNDYIEFPNDESAVNFTEHYKDAAIYPWYGTFDNYYPWRYQDGGDTKKPRGYRVSSAIMNIAHKAVDKNAANTIDTPDNGAPQSTFLMNRKNQQKVFEDEGYTKVDNNDYGPVTNAVNTSKHKDVPIYQKYPDADVDRSNLQKVGTFMDYGIINANTKTNVYNGPVGSYLTDPAHFPVDVYIDRKTGKVYNQGWDYNDYNNIRSTTGISKLKNVAGNILDRIGNPTVVTTGLQENTIKSSEADRYLQSKNPMLSYQKNEDTGEYEIMMNPVIVTAKRTNPVKPKVELRPASELNADEFWDMMEANSKQNGGYLYQTGGPFKIGYAAPPVSSELEGAPITSPAFSTKKLVYGSNEATRARVKEKYPVINQVVDSVAKAYDLNPSVLNNRVDTEGIIDRIAQLNDEAVEGARDFRHNWQTNNPRGYGFPTNGFRWYGLDDVATLIEQGKVQPINEVWEDEWNENEKGRMVHSASGKTWVDNIGLMGATLKYFRSLVEKDFPGKDDKFYDEGALAYWNRGRTGGKKYMQGPRTDSRYKTFSTGGSLGKITPLGQWQYPHQITTIPSNNITMKGVDYPVIGVSNTGDTKVMFPNLDYTFNGNYVMEYPINI